MMDAQFDDKTISIARECREGIVHRLKEIAFSEPATHTSIAAAKLLLEISDCQTQKERDPHGLDELLLRS